MFTPREHMTVNLRSLPYGDTDLIAYWPMNNCQSAESRHGTPRPAAPAAGWSRARRVWRVTAEEEASAAGGG